MATGLDVQDYRRAQLALGPNGASQLQNTIEIGGGGGGAGVGGTISTNITTVGAGTLTAAALIGGVIVRTGSTGAFTDTTATAAALAAAVPSFTAGMSWLVDIQNKTAFAETLAAGAGVTLSGPTIIPPLSTATFLLTLTSATAATLQGIGVATTFSTREIDNTVTTGTGTMVSGAMEGAELVTLTASGQAAITLTTRTAAQIQANVPNWQVGQSYRLRIINNNTGVLTTAGGSNVTMTSTIPPNYYADYNVVFTSATAITATQITSSPLSALPAAKFTSLNVTTGTLAAGAASGSAFVSLLSINATPGVQAMRTPAQILADTPGLVIGQSYVLQIGNQGQGRSRWRRIRGWASR